MEAHDPDRLRKARRAFEAYAACKHGGFSLYCDLCRDKNNILNSRTEMGRFGDSITELQRAGLLDGMEVYEPERDDHQPITLKRLIKVGALFLGTVLVYETLRHKQDIQGVVLHLIKKGRASP